MTKEKKPKLPKTCLYCEYWNGIRATSEERVADPNGSPGQCENEASVFFNQDREKTDSCRRFLLCREE